MAAKPDRPDDRPTTRPRGSKRSKCDNVVIDGDVYTMSAEGAQMLREAIASGRFTGFRSYADDEKA